MSLGSSIFISVLISLLCGGGLGIFLFRLKRQALLRKAQAEAQEMRDEVQEFLELRDLEEKEKMQEIEENLWSRHNADFLKIEEKIELLQEQHDEKKQKWEERLQKLRGENQNYEREVQAQESQIRASEAQLQKLREGRAHQEAKIVEKLTSTLGFSLPNVKSEIREKIEKESRERALKTLEAWDEELKLHSEHRAKHVLDVALDRFARAYCPERGLGAVHFPDAQARQNFCDPEGANMKAVQEACGCDVIIDDEMEMVGIAGYDPVRRELTRRTLEKVLKEKKAIRPELIHRTAQNQKRELLKQIKNDGDAVFRELKLENAHPEIKQMMGSLRYRYSFTQNQYFHCAEVGWLAGLLASELQIDIKKARRSGLLHDIGKSMDHAQDGGHAMIGADFIEKRGEAPDVVHNVRAHHYDVQPGTDHAFLVIAADAMSGGRPGARRSTLESYNQKVSELQDIARSFEGVTDCYVLNGGRECRVMVNGKKVSDLEALDLSKRMARKIEEVCNYPGQIKVVVVRETVVNESTMNAKSHA